MMNILYRCCNKELEFPPKREGRPKWFSKINCFNSLHISFQNSRMKDHMKIVVLMQKINDIPSDFFLFIEKCGYDIVVNDSSGANPNIESYMNQLSYYENNVRPNGDDVYFVEDDYIHSVDALDCIYSGVKRFNLVTGFDCMDRYTRTDDLTDGRDFIYFHEGKHWRTAESTTCTWAATDHAMKDVLPYAKSYGIRDRIMFRHMFQNGIRLYQPMCGVSSHVHDGLLSPGVDWEQINRDSIPQ